MSSTFSSWHDKLCFLGYALTVFWHFQIYWIELNFDMLLAKGSA